jgi:hypothetical protein
VNERDVPGFPGYLRKQANEWDVPDFHDILGSVNIPKERTRGGGGLVLSSGNTALFADFQFGQ